MEIKEALKNRYRIDFAEVAVAGDGGTISFELIDSDGVKHLLFLDRRIGSNTKNHVYAYYYPGDRNSICLGVDQNILKELEK